MESHCFTRRFKVKTVKKLTVKFIMHNAKPMYYKLITAIDGHITPTLD